MDWTALFIYSAAALLVLSLTGMILLFIHHILWKRKRDRIEWDENRLIRKLHNMLFEVTVECLDALPDKIMEAKKTIEGE